jgi:hypothetical protein
VSRVSQSDAGPLSRGVTIPAGLTVGNDFGFYFKCRAGFGYVLHPPIEITRVIGKVPKNPLCPKSLFLRQSETLTIRLPKSAIESASKRNDYGQPGREAIGSIENHQNRQGCEFTREVMPRRESMTSAIVEDLKSARKQEGIGSAKYRKSLKRVVDVTVTGIEPVPPGCKAISTLNQVIVQPLLNAAIVPKLNPFGCFKAAPRNQHHLKPFDDALLVAFLLQRLDRGLKEVKNNLVQLRQLCRQQS